jgi:NAD-dependent SIR2 family protein deacetylase
MSVHNALHTMTDAEFMLETCGRHRNIIEENITFCEKFEGIKEARERNITQLRGELAKLDALEALAKLKWNRHILRCVDPGAGKMCERCEALRKFRAAVEGKR